jgi:hypothetical protein
MGWNPPHREDATLVFNESLNAFLKEEVMTLPEMVHTFNIDKISRAPVQFTIDKLEYLNT